MDVPELTQSSVHGHLHCFQCLQIVNDAATNRLVHMHFLTVGDIPSGQGP